MRNFHLILLSMLVLTNGVSAGPLQDVADGAGDAVGYVGKTVGNTAKAVGKSVEGTADRITGDVDIAKGQRETDQMAKQALARLFKLDPKAKALFDQSYGYAVFDSRKSAFLITFGSGAGVAVSKADGKRTYMRMVTAGANIGMGLQFFQNIFLFETKRTFDNFVSSGWEAGTSAGTAFGRDSIDAQVRFIDGMAFFQLADTGVILAADITGTKYWKDGTLNQKS